MYVPYSGACDQPNSATPMTAARIAAQDARISRVGRYFTGGNQTMAEIVAALTPPVGSGLCDDFTDSSSMENMSPFPVPTPGTVPAAVTARLLAAAAAAAAAGGPAPGSGPGSGPAAWVWTNPGGGASYPHGVLQRDVSRLLPAWDWRCGSGAAAGAVKGTPSLSPLWWLLGGVALWGFLSGGDRSR